MANHKLWKTRVSLVESLKNRDKNKTAVARREQRWREFLLIYQPSLLRWAQRRIWNRFDAEEAVHEVVLKVYREIGNYDLSRGSFRGWLKTLTVRVAIDFLRKPKYEQLGTPDAIAELVEDLDAFDPRLELLRVALKNVECQYSRPPSKPHTWLAFKRTFLDGLRPVDVAVEMGVDEDIINTAVHRVTAKVKVEGQRLREEWPGLFEG